MSETIPAADARANFSELLAKAYYQGQFFVVRKSRRPMAVIIGINEFKAMQKQALAGASASVATTAQKVDPTKHQQGGARTVNKALSVSF